MSEFHFDPPVMLTTNVAVVTLDDAAACVRSFHGTPRSMVQESVLHRLEGARTDEEQRDAANNFVIWALSEGLLTRPGPITEGPPLWRVGPAGTPWRS